MGYPFYHRYPRDFFEGTIGMPFEVKGAYGLLLDLIYLRDGRLPDDARFIAGHLGLSVRKWNLIRQTLLEWPNANGTIGKIKADQGIISTLRSDNLTIMRRSSRDNVEIKPAADKEIKDLQSPRAGVRAPASEPDSESKGAALIRGREASEDDWPDGKPFDHAQILVREAEAVNFSLDRSPGLGQGIAALHRWRRDGASWEHDVVPVVTALARKARTPIKSWSYFEDAVAANVAATRAAMTIPEHTDVHRPRTGQPVNGHDTRKAGGLAFLAEVGRDNRGDDPGG